ncbi:FG-GAP-like repeat-containing protein [Streptomyces abyssomicinicus]|uniref:FG-GAP-like repeat-containing protein n=1 Tax=Streptomyces abyssomicinicus TaxID=574929 RepID=UPI001250BB86|nr:FG-GAP-like repeat-containing protein [Streptomyces abyssomicinicus]
MHKKTRTALAAVAAAALTGGLLTFAASTAVAADGTLVAKADFNKDKKGDIATTAAWAHVGGKANAGQVVALYGTSTGVNSTKRTVISQDTSGVPGAAEVDDLFGYETAYGDFNGDGYDDLAVGAPGEATTAGELAGSVTLLWGTASGITGTSAVTVKDPAAGADRIWGYTLAAGDFDGDGRTDLAIGGADTTLFVYKGGFTKTGGTGGYYAVDLPLYEGAWKLHAGDVNNDRATDLVVNGDALPDLDAPTEELESYVPEQNTLLFGSASGLTAAGHQSLRPGLITGIGDINGDKFGDIVSGFSWNEELGGETIPYGAKGGKVWISYGSATGVGKIAGITQDTSGVPGSSETDDGFGASLDLGNVNGDAYLDLVVGVPGEDVDGVDETGSLVVLYGTASGITGTGAQSFHQGTAGVPGGNEWGDWLGIDVKLDDVTGDGKADLIAGSDENGNGAVLYMPASGSKITATGSRSISPTSVGVSTAEYPGFGWTFAD